jgi:hypothetical protein
VAQTNTAISEQPCRGEARLALPNISPDQLAANRANSLHSTGPKTVEGKLASSRNSLKHGLAAGQLVIPGEDPAAFETLLNELIEDRQPANIAEELLVKEMAQAYWLSQRAIRLQNECFTENGVDEKRLSLFLRYQTTYDRAFHKALDQLIRLQKERHKLRGFVSQSDDSPVLLKPGLKRQPTLDPGFVSQNPSVSPSEGVLKTSEAA